MDTYSISRTKSRPPKAPSISSSALNTSPAGLPPASSFPQGVQEENPG